MGTKYLLFRIGSGQYATALEEVSQILRYENVVDVPTAPRFIDGVINLSGDVVPVVNLRKRFSLPEAEITRRNRVIVLQRQERRYGLLVDSVQEILELEEENIVPEAASVFGMRAEFVIGIAKVREALLVLLDVFKVLATPPEVPIRE